MACVEPNAVQFLRYKMLFGGRNSFRAIDFLPLVYCAEGRGGFVRWSSISAGVLPSIILNAGLPLAATCSWLFLLSIVIQNSYNSI